MSQLHFRRLLIDSGSLPVQAREALQRSLEAANTQAARAAQLQAARVLLAETQLRDIDVAGLVDLPLVEIGALRDAGLPRAA